MQPQSRARSGLTRPQWQIYEAGWQPSSRFRVAVCGRRFGKSFLMAEELRRAARLAVSRGVSAENEIWYAAPTFRQAKRVMWERLRATIPHNWVKTASETECLLRLRSGHAIRLVGLDRHDALRGAGLWFFGGDEWADCRPEAWSQTIRPMLSTAAGHALFIGTPKGFDHLHEAFVRGATGGCADYRSFSFSTTDGGNVPDAELESARDILDPRTYRQEYEASFETYAGRVVYGFSRADSVKSMPFNENRPLHIGMDFNVNPMSATVWQDVGDTTYQIDEIVLPTSNTDEMCAEISRRFGRQGFDAARACSSCSITIYPDPAGAQRRSSAQGRTDISILRSHGFQVNALSSHPLVRDRMNVVNSWFQSESGVRRAFVDPRCSKSITAYERLVYREGTAEPDKGGGHDHLVDATGYYLFTRTTTSSVSGRRADFNIGR